MTLRKCPRCGGADGAHYTECVVGRLFERLLGDGYPWKAPIAPVTSIDQVSDELISEIGQKYSAGAIDHARALQERITKLQTERDQLQAELDEALEHVTRPDPPDHPQRGDVISEAQQLIDDTDGETAASIGEALDTGTPVDTPTPPVTEPAPTKVGRGHQYPIDSPQSRTKPETVRTEAATAKYVAAHLVPAEGSRKDEKGFSWPAYVTAPELLAGYERWAQANDEPINRGVTRFLGAAASRLAPKKKQGPRHGNSKPISYFGVKLLDASTPESTEPPLEEQMAQRRTAEAAAQEKLGEPAETTKERYRYTGPRPGQEIPKDYREMLEPLWETPGWGYAPRNSNGGGKPRIILPTGAGYTLANTPSDRRGVLNMRAQLRRLGAPIR